METAPIRTSSKRGNRVGPLDVENPLADPFSDDVPQPSNSPRPPRPNGDEALLSPAQKSLKSPTSPALSIGRELEVPLKDFGHLLLPDIFHPLSQLDLPPPFRSSSKLPDSTTPLDQLLSGGHFRQAAINAAEALTKSTSSTDAPQIFSLFYIRLASVCIINADLLAAQESKALEDLNSSYYRNPLTDAHLVPWELRVLGVRLQSIGYQDPRRGITGYYELAREARVEAQKARDSVEKALWKARLEDLGIRVANALIEMSDLPTAARHLESLKISKGRGNSDQEFLMTYRLILLYLRLGNVAAAKRHLSAASPPDSDTRSQLYHAIVLSLVHVAEGNYHSASKELSSQAREAEDLPSQVVLSQNLAVCLLYEGKIAEARETLQSLIDQGNSLSTLLFNLSTIFELCSDRSKGMKLELAEKIATQDRNDQEFGWEKASADFKL
ncbi:hypothetical protein MMC25_001120 [Agyrium rufum]|nr:hypothetical protein [Agyrium rufum]